MEKTGRLLAVASMVCVLAAPLAVLPGIKVYPGQPLWDILPEWLVLGAYDGVEGIKLLLLRLAALLAVLSAALYPRRALSPQPLAVVGAAGLIWGLLACSVSPHPVWSISAFADVACWIVLCMAWRVVLLEDDASRLLQGLALVAAVVAGYALAQRLGVDPVAWTTPEYSQVRTIGTLANPNFLAHFEVAVIPILAPLAVVRSPILWGSAAVLVSLSLVITQTRGAAVALAVAAIVMAVGRPRLAPWLLVGALLVGGGILSQRSIDPSERNAAARLYLWQVAWRLIEERPLQGVGPGVFTFAALQHRDLEPPEIRQRMALPEDPHNIVLALAASAGIPAALLGLVAVGMAWLLAWQRRADVLALGIAGSLVAFTVNALFVYPTAGSIVPCLIALSLAAPLDSRSRGGRWPAVVAAIPLAILVVLGVRVLAADFQMKRAVEVEAGVPLQSDGKEWSRACTLAAGWPPTAFTAWHQHGKWAEQQQKVRDAAIAYESAIAINPLHPYPYMDLGRLLNGVPGLEQVAESAHLSAVGRDPFNPWFLTDTGLFYLRRGQPDKAMQFIERSLAFHTMSVNVAARGLALVELGRKEEACAALEQAAALQPPTALVEALRRKLE